VNHRRVSSHVPARTAVALLFCVVVVVILAVIGIAVIVVVVVAIVVVVRQSLWAFQANDDGRVREIREIDELRIVNLCLCTETKRNETKTNSDPHPSDN
jgi:hypothetical protein